MESVFALFNQEFWLRPAGPALRTPLQRLRHAVFGLLLVGLTAGGAFLLRLNLSGAGSVELLLVVLVALRLGYFQATVVSIGAVFALNYLFTPPIFKFTVADPQNWISLGTFEAAALLVSRLSSKVRSNAALAEARQLRTLKLFELSRAILLIDGRNSVTEQLSALIRELIQVEQVEIRVTANQTGDLSSTPSLQDEPEIDDPILRLSRRVLRLGTAPIGNIILTGWDTDILLADAVGSLAAIAIERARAIQRENRAEAERDVEQLRTTVLDGLAHGFKTPLTAIQTASSGLLAIDHLTPTQTELVSIIDEQATRLNHMTTRLLQTASLETREVRLRRSPVMITDLLDRALALQEADTRQRVDRYVPLDLSPDLIDPAMVETALAQLLDNAARYSVINTRIQVWIAQEAFETSVVVVNEGPSIRPQDRDRIFERFYRGVDPAHGPTGTGLGLSIVKKTAEAHGGRAWVECDAGVVRFNFTLLGGRKATHG